uniref:Uncharacterized protein n=1 Tax=Rhodosorus marinus TaxID=101924 RepID=A0A7S0G2X0_9RHOD|mmetsp:Transcript_18251/g.26494  ORF Transcript_18251/g.26494 Transcript_18251/m.26494 type:complete len:274 (+) Transcript_18251:234-1055(+)
MDGSSFVTVTGCGRREFRTSSACRRRCVLNVENSKKPATVWERIDETLWNFTFGWKEKKWSPKKHGKAFNRRESSLSWGAEQDVLSGYALTEEFLAGLGCAAEEQKLAKAKTGTMYVSETTEKLDSSLNLTIQKMADWADVPKDEDLRLVDGRTLAELCFCKYGKYHDMNILQSQPFGSEHRQVAFNIYHPALGETIFPYSEEEYLSKLNKVSSLLNSVDQAWFVRKFLQEPIKPRRGLPSTPRWDTAVTLRLNTSPTWSYVPVEVVDQFFYY